MSRDESDWLPVLEKALADFDFGDISDVLRRFLRMQAIRVARKVSSTGREHHACSDGFEIRMWRDGWMRIAATPPESMIGLWNKESE